RLSPEKSVRVMAAVERALVAAGITNIRFTVVGDGSDRQWLERHLHRATFLGVLQGDDLAAGYADMDLFLFPSETETVGNVVLEAMASGVPVLAMARGGHTFIVGRGDGAVLARDRAEFVAAACSLVPDVARRAAMSAAARVHALDMSWDRVFEGVYRAY